MTEGKTLGHWASKPTSTTLAKEQELRQDICLQNLFNHQPETMLKFRDLLYEREPFRKGLTKEEKQC